MGLLNRIKPSTKKFRILGGVPVTDRNKYPWMAGIIRRNRDPIDGQFCGGSLIHPSWVVTAAHCLFRRDPDNLDVILGLLRLDEEPEDRIHAKELIIHPQYNEDTTDFDIALIRLADASRQKTIAMIPSGDPDRIVAPGVMATIIGWGSLEEGGEGSLELMHVDVPIVSNAEANEAYEGGVTERMIAAGFPAGGKDACQGDSGGPFVVRDVNLNLVLAGTTSWGWGCARPRLPGLYANIAVLGDWVRQTIES